MGRTSKNLYTFLLLFTILCVHRVLFSSAAVDFGGGHQLLSYNLVKSECRGSIADCMLAGDEEFEMDSEINRRILATTRYISYGALKGNTIPCSRRGASYYNCRPGAQANPYNRGCSRITRCRR